MEEINKEIKRAAEQITTSLEGGVPPEAVKSMIEDRIRMAVVEAMRIQANAVHGVANKLAIGG